LGGEGVAHHVAEVVGHEFGTLDVEGIENARDITGLGFLVVIGLGMRRQAHAAQIGTITV
jgi:hypothetical protein